MTPSAAAVVRAVASVAIQFTLAARLITLTELAAIKDRAGRSGALAMDSWVALLARYGANSGSELKPEQINSVAVNLEKAMQAKKAVGNGVAVDSGAAVG